MTRNPRVQALRAAVGFPCAHRHPEHSTVTGQGSAQVVRIGREYAYRIDSPQFHTLRTNVARYVGNATPTFQGGYSGSDFMVQ